MKRYRDGSEELSHTDRQVDKLDFVSREDAVVDGVMANGLVDNRQPGLALAYVLEVVKAREEEQVGWLRLRGFWFEFICLGGMYVGYIYIRCLFLPPAV